MFIGAVLQGVFRDGISEFMHVFEVACVLLGVIAVFPILPIRVVVAYGARQLEEAGRLFV